MGREGVTLRISIISLSVGIIAAIALLVLMAIFYVLFGEHLGLEFLSIIVLVVVALGLFLLTVKELRIDGLGITYRNGLRKRTIIWNNLADVLFVILPGPDRQHTVEWLKEHPPMEFEDRPYVPMTSTYRDGHFYPRREDPPEFQCSMTFTGDKVINFRTGRYHGPSPKEMRAAWEYIREKQHFYDFEAKMERQYPRSYKGLPKLLRPV